MSTTLQRGMVALALAAWLVPALAQADDKDNQRTVRITSTEMPEMWLFKASDLIGKEVRNNTDEKLGKIYDLAVDTTDGRISYAVLQFGGFLGVGDKLFAIPWDALQLKPRDRARDNELIFIFNVDKDRLKSAPGFDQNAWPDMADNTWTTTVHTYWEKESSLNPNRMKITRIETKEGTVKLVRRAHKELIGRDIKNAKFEGIGNVNDLAVDVISGHAVYIVAQLDSKANATDETNKTIDGDLVALPWNALQLKPDQAKGTQDTFVLNVADTKLRGIPAFKKRDWPNMNDMAWNQKVYRIYGVHGFWNDDRQARSNLGD